MNLFIQPYVQGVQQALQFGLFDPRSSREARPRFTRDSVPLLSRVNSFYVPTGRWPARGWILSARGEYNQLNTYATNFMLELGDSTQANNTAIFSNLAIVQAQCVTRGLVTDPSALYLVELTDTRGILSNQWFHYPLTAQYNVRAPAYPSTFMPGSMQYTGGGYTTWTWATMVENIWNVLSAFLGVWPGFPIGYNVSGTPEGFSFVGVSAWEVLNDILEHIGLTIACDLTQISPYTIVNPGAIDNNFLTLQASLATNLEDDLEWIDKGAGRVPATVVVLFKRRNAVYGTEETVTYGQYAGAVPAAPFQWQMFPYYSVTVNAPLTFLGAVGVHYLWDDFTVSYDMDNNPISADTATAASIAAERVSQYFAKIYRQTLGYMSQTYTGALSFTTGSMVDGVCWYQDYKDVDWHGWKTKIVRGMEPPFDAVGLSSRSVSGY